MGNQAKTNWQVITKLFGLNIMLLVKINNSIENYLLLTDLLLRKRFVECKDQSTFVNVYNFQHLVYVGFSHLYITLV